MGIILLLIIYICVFNKVKYQNIWKPVLYGLTAIVCFTVDANLEILGIPDVLANAISKENVYFIGGFSFLLMIVEIACMNLEALGEPIDLSIFLVFMYLDSLILAGMLFVILYFARCRVNKTRLNEILVALTFSLITLSILKTKMLSMTISEGKALDLALMSIIIVTFINISKRVLINREYLGFGFLLCLLNYYELNIYSQVACGLIGVATLILLHEKSHEIIKEKTRLNLSWLMITNLTFVSKKNNDKKYSRISDHDFEVGFSTSTVMVFWIITFITVFSWKYI